MSAICGISLMDGQVAEIKDASGRILLRVRIVPDASGQDGPTVEVGFEPGEGRKRATFSYSLGAWARLRALSDGA